MPDSRHADTAARPDAAYWDRWFRELGVSQDDDAERLRRRWREAVEHWWRSAAAGLDPEAAGFLRRIIDQAELLFRRAGEPARPGKGEAPATGGDCRDRGLWCMPLELWEHAAVAMLGTDDATSGTASDPRALTARRRYAAALHEYASLLEGVGEETLTRLSERLDAAHREGRAPRRLREIFDLCVDEGEACYLETVASDDFAEIGGRLINSLAALVRLGDTRADATHDTTTGSRRAAAPRAGSGTRPRREAALRGAHGLLDTAGLEPRETLAELRAFSRKLGTALETLHGLGAIEVGSCRRQAVHREGKLVLYRYEPTRPTRHSVPLLIVYALANRPYIMDLEADRSLIRGLLDAGLEVYLIDWGYPDEAQRRLDLDAYVSGLIDRCVDHVRSRHAGAPIDLLGVCQGGTFALCYGALKPDKVSNLVTMVTPVDFHAGSNLLSHWLRHVDVDLLVDTLGNVPGPLLNWAFVSLKPLKLTGRKYLDMLDQLEDATKARTFLRMERWIHDSPAQAGEAFRQFTRDLFQDNKLVKDELELGGRRVSLRNVTMPVLNVYAEEDHIVPPAGTLALGSYVGSSDYGVLGFEGGHIGIYVSARAQREVPPKIAEWLLSRTRPGGSRSLV